MQTHEDLINLLKAWCDTLEVITPTEGLMKGKYCLRFTVGQGEHKHCYGLIVAHNSYDEVSLSTIQGLLEHSKLAIDEFQKVNS